MLCYVGIGNTVITLEYCKIWKTPTKIRSFSDPLWKIGFTFQIILRFHVITGNEKQNKMLQQHPIDESLLSKEKKETEYGIRLVYLTKNWSVSVTDYFVLIGIFSAVGRVGLQCVWSWTSTSTTGSSQYHRSRWLQLNPHDSIQKSSWCICGLWYLAYG